MRRVLLAVALLGGCAASSEAPTVAPVATCMRAPEVPVAPPATRTVARLRQYAIDLELAREAERRRGDDCAAKLAAVQE